MRTLLHESDTTLQALPELGHEFEKEDLQMDPLSATFTVLVLVCPYYIKCGLSDKQTSTHVPVFGEKVALMTHAVPLLPLADPFGLIDIPGGY